MICPKKKAKISAKMFRHFWAVIYCKKTVSGAMHKTSINTIGVKYFPIRTHTRCDKSYYYII